MKTRQKKRYPGGVRALEYLICEGIALALLIFCHELGHYLMAKIRGNYKAWGFSPNPHIKLTNRYPHRWDYLSGFAGSAIGLPIWILVAPWQWFLLLMCGAGSLDFVTVVLYGRLIKRLEGN